VDRVDSRVEDVVQEDVDSEDRSIKEWEDKEDLRALEDHPRDSEREAEEEGAGEEEEEEEEEDREVRGSHAVTLSNERRSWERMARQEERVKDWKIK